MPKLISERSASKATPAKVIKYILDPAKCCIDNNGNVIMSIYALDENRSYSQQFQETAELRGNDYTSLDRKYYHFKMAFHPDDAVQNGGIVTPEMALEMAQKWHEKHFPEYEAVITIQYHNDPERGNQEHLHAHIVVNASSFECDKNKIKLSNRDLDDLRDTAFYIGKEYGLQENYWRDEVEKKIEKRLSRQKNRPQEEVYLTQGEQNLIAKYGRDFSSYSFKDQYRIAIDEAKIETGSIENFILYLKEHFSIDTKITQQRNIKYKLSDRNTYTTGKALGTLYELDAVEEALAANKNKLENQLNNRIQKAKQQPPGGTVEIKARQDRELQAMIDCVALCRECGANTVADFKLTVKKKGAELGTLRKQIRRAEQTGDISRVEELKKEETVAKNEYGRYARALEYRALLEERQFNFNSPESVKLLSESSDKDGIKRTKEQAVQEKNRQHSDLREWIDQACESIGSTTSEGLVQDLKLFIEELEKHGCIVRITENTISLKHPDSKQPVRTNRLGDEYSMSAIKDNILIQREIQLKQRQRENYHEQTKTKNKARKTPTYEL